MKIQLEKLPWWKRILFHFLKTHIGYDFGSDTDKSVVMIFKKWRGVTYLVDEYEVGKDL